MRRMLSIGGGCAIVRMPYGAHPFYSRGEYVQDVAFVQAYFTASAAGGKALRGFIDRYCREPETHADYLERIGLKRLLDLYEY